MGCEQNCFNEHRLEELEKIVHEMKEKHSKRDGVFFERINALETKIVLYNNDLGHIKDTVDEMNDNLKSLMEAPAKRYDGRDRGYCRICTKRYLSGIISNSTCKGGGGIMNYTDFSEDERKFYLSESGFDSREKEFFRLRVYQEKTLFETAEIMGYIPRTIDRINRKVKKKIVKVAPMYYRGFSLYHGENMAK